MASYKELKEQFVTGFSGSNPFDIGIVCFFVSVTFTKATLLLRQVLFSRPNFIVDFVLTILPAIFSVGWTKYNYLKIGIILVVLLIKKDKFTNPFYNTRPSYSVSNYQIIFSYITEYRSLMLIITCVSILAVDFPYFPREFVKTETFGVSLMDLGTGSVLFASALVSRHDRNSSDSIQERCKKSIMSALPLIVMGNVRLIVHTAIGYQEHVSEYGVHWNFYNSLTVVVLLSGLIKLRPYAYVALSVGLMVLYEILLKIGLTEYILYAERTGFFSSNREGILGSIGFFCIYHIGIAIRPFLFNTKGSLSNLLRITLISIVFCTLSFLFINPSRRLVVFI